MNSTDQMPIGRHDGPATPPPQAQPDPAGTRDEDRDEDRERSGPLAQWWQASRADSAARKQRAGEGKAWWMARWMREQPTSVSDHVDFFLGQRVERPDGRRGWGLRTASPLINGLHAAFYITFGLTWGLAATLIGYAATWMQQRPGRAFLTALALYVIHTNVSTWIAGA